MPTHLTRHPSCESVRGIRRIRHCRDIVIGRRVVKGERGWWCLSRVPIVKTQMRMIFFKAIIIVDSKAVSLKEDAILCQYGKEMKKGTGAYPRALKSSMTSKLDYV